MVRTVPVKRDVHIFVTYSHEDKPYCTALVKSLSPLVQSGRVHIWHDGRIEPGKEWEPAIQEELNRADLVIALVTSNFFASLYCVERELARSREREKQGLCDLIPVLVEACDYPAHWIGKLQLLPAEGPVLEFAHVPRGWTQVAQGVRLKVEGLLGNRPVLNALDGRAETLHSGLLPFVDDPSRSGCHEFENVSSFWQARSHLNSISMATVKATLSRYAPLTMGPPMAKRRLHKDFRQLIETDRAFGKEKSLTIDACMSLSAGQMVVRETLEEKPKLVLGLYSSIVRNSIPVFVRRDYYKRVVRPLFEESGGTESFEASVTGHVFSLENDFLRRFLVRQGLTDILRQESVDDLCTNALALEVGGEGTKISALSLAHYVDGDIWMAIRRPDGGERFMTEFVDLTDAADRVQGLENIDKLTAAAGFEVFARYDNVPSFENLDPKIRPGTSARES